VAIVIAALGFAFDRAATLPWPSMATRSLAGLFLLVALTRVAGELGVRGQEYARFGVAGVALTASVWFAGGAMVLGRPALGVLAALHALAGALAWGREPDAAVAERGRLVVAATSAGVSLLAISALPREAGVPGTPTLPVVLALVEAGGVFALVRGRMLGLVLTAVAGTFTLAITARTLAALDASGLAARGAALELAPVLALSAVIAALVPMVSLGRRLPGMWQVLAPSATPLERQLLAWATYPAVATLAVVIAW
jgi:hypothetical protein